MMTTGEMLSPPAHDARLPLALVVDHDAANRQQLSSQLRPLGYAVRACGDTQAAVAACAEQRFDIVFVDIAAATPESIETTRRLHGRPRDGLLPVVLVATLADDANLEACLAAGADDVLLRPIEPRLLEVRVNALRRTQALQRRVGDLIEAQRRDEAVAERVFSGAVGHKNLEHPAIITELCTVSAFGSDFYLGARAPSGDVHVMLGDFTRRGLAAAIGALPTSEVFRAMVAKGFAPEQVLRAIDGKLRALLPAGMVLATHYVVVAADLASLRVANCGMPPLHVVTRDGSITRVDAHSVALGVDADALLRMGLETLTLTPGTRILLQTDGFADTTNARGEVFGQARVERVVETVAHDRGEFPAALRSAVVEFTGRGLPEYDCAAVEIRCEPDLVANADDDTIVAARGPRLDGEWRFELTLHGAELRAVDPVPLIIDHARELVGDGMASAELFTVLTELYVNALDHGVLGLDSELKRGPDGFIRYMDERMQRLAGLDQGWVRISLDARHADGLPHIAITVADSGAGYDPAGVVAAGSPASPFGRGLMLLRGLCGDIEVRAGGSETRVVYPLAATT